MEKLNKNEYIKDLSKLISFKSVTSDRKENEKALDFIESKIDERAIIKRIKNEGVTSFVVSNKNTCTPDVCFLVHTDVVAGKPEQFTMKIRNGIAYGRGVSDMKFSIPIGCALLNDLIENKSKLSFACVITTDEETGGFKGAKYLADVYKLQPKVLIVPDGGDNFVFVNKSKGVCALRIDSVGIPAHSSRVWDGKNAIEPLIKLCNEVLLKYEKNNKKESMKTTVNIGKIQGGVSANQVCPEAFVVLDFRFPETTTFKSIFDEVSMIAKKIDPLLKISTYSIGAPTSVDKNNPIVKLFIKNMEKSLGRKIEIKPTYGASDARHFVETGAPVLMIKPNGGDIHGDNENIDIESCLVFYEALKNYIKKLENEKN